MTKRKLLIISINSVHTFNFIELVQHYFDEILLVTDDINPDYKGKSAYLNFRITLRNLLFNPGKLRKIILDFQPTIIHAHQANSIGLYGALATKGLNIPKVLTAWGSDVLVNPGRNLIFKAITVKSLNSYDYLTSDAQVLSDHITPLLKKPVPILLANFGIDSDSSPISAQREKIIYSNRLHNPLYRIGTIVSAFASLVKEDPEWKLVLGAVGQETAALKQQVRDLGLEDHVEFIGWVTKETNAYWYKKARYWVSIPKSDATAISLLEAMYLGCVPIVSDLPASKEWIDHGVNGIVVQEVDSSFFPLAKDLNVEKVQEINRNKIEKDGTKEANAAKFISVYDRLLTTTHGKKN